MSKPSPSRHAPEEIDAYLAALPEDRRAALARVRAIIREAAPDATERISYKIPIFRLGRDLLGLSAQTDHCSLHLMSPALTEAMGDKLDAFEVSGATIHFTPDGPLPRELIGLIVAARIEELSSSG